MKRFRRFVKLESGQSIVIVALAMVSMLALAGLAIDGGNLFLQRRRAQNAADAGSLGGTRVLAELISTCNTDSSKDSEVLAMVNEMVETNGFLSSEGSTWTAYYVNQASSQVGTVGSGSIPNSATGVEVDLGAVFPTHFMKVVGIDDGSVGVDATAMTGRLLQAEGGLIPIGVPLKVAIALPEDDKWAAFDDSEYFCALQPDGECDEINDGDPASQRGWLNLNYIYNTIQDDSTQDAILNRTCSAVVGTNYCNNPPPGLRGYASGQCPYPYSIWAGTPPRGWNEGDGTYQEHFVDGDFIHGEPGAAASGSASVYEGYNLGDILYAPVFDMIYDADDWNDDDPDGDDYFPLPVESTELQWECNINGWPGSNGFMYHVVGWIAFGLEDPTLFGKKYKLNNPRGVYGQFKDPYIGAGLIDPGEGFGQECHSYLVYGVNLWE